MMAIRSSIQLASAAMSQDQIRSVSYTEIARATERLSHIKLADLKIQFRVFVKPLYCNATLDTVRDSDINVIRNNVYYLARTTKNFKDVLEQLLENDVLTHDDAETINSKGYPLLKAVTMYAIIISKEDSMFPVLLFVLQHTGNGNLVKLMNIDLQPQATGHDEVDSASTNLERLQLNCNFLKSAENSNKINKTGGSSNGHPIKLEFDPEIGATNREEDWTTNPLEMKIKKEIDETWTVTCRHCSFLNPEVNSICEVCGHSIISLITGIEECPRCTLVNHAGVLVCEACGCDLKMPTPTPPNKCGA